MPLLDERGGPNHVGNFCSAPIHYDARSRVIHYQSSYDYIGHFARFVRPGARRVALANPREDLDAIAFRNPDAGVVVVAMNRADVPVQLSVTVGDAGASGELPAHAILTLEWPARPPGGGT